MSEQINVKEIIRAEYEKCASEVDYFITRYAYITHPIRGRVLFNLYPFQRTTLKLFQKHDYTIINKSRQLGISTLMAGYALWLMLFSKDKTVLVIATKQITAQNMVEKVKFMYHNLPSWFRLKRPLVDSALSLKLFNNSQIIASSASPDAARSYAVSLLVIDETAFIDNAENIYTAIKPTIATGGKCMIASTPNGVGNFFHSTWVSAELGTTDFLPVKLNWDVHPERDKVWFEKECANMSPRMIAQEYCCDFLSSGHTLIDANILEYYSNTFIREPNERRGLGHEYWIWEYPDYSQQYIISADTARGDGADYSTFHVININNYEQVAEFKGKLGTREFAQALIAAGMEYNEAILVIENSSLGWDVVQTIIEKGYQNLYYSPKGSYITAENYLDHSNSNQVVPGFTNSLKTRPIVIGKLEEAFRDKSFILHSRRTLEELRTFIWEHGRVAGAQGCNDDLCMALSFGIYIRDTALKYDSYGITSLKQNIESIQRPVGVYTTNASELGFNYWNMNTGTQNHERENLGWLID